MLAAEHDIVIATILTSLYRMMFFFTPCQIKHFKKPCIAGYFYPHWKTYYSNWKVDDTVPTYWFIRTLYQPTFRYLCHLFWPSGTVVKSMLYVFTNLQVTDLYTSPLGSPLNLMSGRGPLWKTRRLEPFKRGLGPNKYSLYQVYMGLITKGVIPRVLTFYLWLSRWWYLPKRNISAGTMTFDVPKSTTGAVVICNQSIKFQNLLTHKNKFGWFQP